MELLTSTSAEQFQQCAEFLPLRNRGFGTLAVTVLPVPYIRTSSAANVGTDKVSDKNALKQARQEGDRPGKPVYLGTTSGT
jgi:hypothetical protein